MLLLLLLLLLQARRQLPWYALLLERWTSPWRLLFDMADTVVWERDLQGCFERDAAKAKRVFEQHNEEVIKVRAR